MAVDISFADYLELRNLVFEWAESYDTKDWPRLQRILAPSVRLDFRAFGGPLHESLTPQEYAAVHEHVIGDKRLKTQHFVGAIHYERLEDGRIAAKNQVRVAHQRYTDESLTEVVNHGHGHGLTLHWYAKIDGRWKIDAVTPQLGWTEYDLMGTLDVDISKVGPK